jgi:hypothetical protein
MTDEIQFDAATHTYWLGNRKLESVTTVIKELVPPFDRERISAKTAKKRGVSQEELLAEWDRKGQAGRDRGTKVHAYIEDVLNGKKDELLAAFNDTLPEFVAFDAAWRSMQQKLQAGVRAKETRVWHEELGLAGTVDLLLNVVLPNKNCDTIVVDWKTGDFQTTNRYERLLAPFEDLDNCELHVYSLQTSLYRVLLERRGISTHEAYLVHLSGTGAYHGFRALDLRERVTEWAKMRTGK